MAACVAASFQVWPQRGRPSSRYPPGQSFQEPRIELCGRLSVALGGQAARGRAAGPPGPAAVRLSRAQPRPAAQPRRADRGDLVAGGARRARAPPSRRCSRGCAGCWGRAGSTAAARSGSRCRWTCRWTSTRPSARLRRRRPRWPAGRPHEAIRQRRTGAGGDRGRPAPGPRRALAGRAPARPRGARAAGARVHRGGRAGAGRRRAGRGRARGPPRGRAGALPRDRVPAPDGGPGGQGRHRGGAAAPTSGCAACCATSWAPPPRPRSRRSTRRLLRAGAPPPRRGPTLGQRLVHRDRTRFVGRRARARPVRPAVRRRPPAQRGAGPRPGRYRQERAAARGGPARTRARLDAPPRGRPGPAARARRAARRPWPG